MEFYLFNASAECLKYHDTSYHKYHEVYFFQSIFEATAMPLECATILPFDIKSMGCKNIPAKISYFLQYFLQLIMVQYNLREPEYGLVIL